MVLLNHDTLLYPHHLDDGRLYDFSRPSAAITPTPATRDGGVEESERGRSGR